MRGAVGTAGGLERNLAGAKGAFSGRRLGRRFVLGLGQRTIGHFDQHEHGEGDDHEVDDRVQKHAVIDGGSPGDKVVATILSVGCGPVVR